MAAYALLGAAGLTVDHREMRLMLWVALVGLAVKSYVGYLREEQRRRQ
jgi:hypothetical protein